MKKKFAVAGALLLAVLTLALFAACGKTYVGLYKLVSISYGGVEYKVGDDFPPLGGKLTADSFTIELKEDGTAVMKSTQSSADGEKGTWTEKGENELEITFNGVAESGQCDGSSLTIDESGMKMSFKK